MSSESVEWIKAESPGEDGPCVEMRRVDGMIQVRDGRDRDGGPVLTFTPGEWDAWLDGAKKGEFDHLITSPASGRGAVAGG
jgi:hypothetical protein